ncbi:tetratricopeptide repeat protein [Niabella insulamsoli]|uniref:tetratricopeptide repeat protein n=1 Tax=Niabella insulamsoli TaxID=3144874 RepID=UPI0031FC7A69
MADNINTRAENESLETNDPVEKAKEVWNKNGKNIALFLGVIIVAVGGFFAYKHFVKGPKEAEALDKIFTAEKYFAADSINLALNGDGANPGFVKIADSYSGTPSGNLAKYYAGVCFIKLNQNDKAVKYLEDFSTDSKQIQQRAYALLGDAYGDLGKGAEALDYYKKAANHFDADPQASSEALFRGAYLAQHVLNNKEEAIGLYKELKQKYPRTQQGFEADKYLAQLGVYNVN